MSRSLPVIRFGDSDFLVDLLRMEFRQQNNPANRISFLELINNGDHLLLHYNRVTCNAAGVSASEKGEDKVVTIRIPPLKDLDPFRFTLLQGRRDARLELLTKAAKLLSTPKIRQQRHKIGSNRYGNRL